jgi:hypothetical protein
LTSWGKRWSYDKSKEEKTRENDITVFSSLADLTENVVPQKISRAIEKTFDIGEVVVAKIRKEETHLGDFTLMFKKGDHMKNRDLLALYLSELGLFLEKNRLSGELKTSREMFLHSCRIRSCRISLLRHKRIDHLRQQESFLI